VQGSNDKHLVASADMSLSQVLACVQPSPPPGSETAAASAAADAHSDASSASAGEQQAAAPLAVPLDRSYWTLRFWNFLTRMSELKSRPKDEKGAMLFGLHEPPPVPLPGPTAAEQAARAQRKASVGGGPWVGAACAVKE